MFPSTMTASLRTRYYSTSDRRIRAAIEGGISPIVAFISLSGNTSDVLGCAINAPGTAVRVGFRKTLASLRLRK